jgi:AcrR family transcriptional regulator
VTGVDVRRPPGRPRSVECDRAILDAAMTEYAEGGFDGMSVDAVAARAGVSKATIYRRYPSKLELVATAIYTVAEDRAPRPDTGSLRGDLRTAMRNLRDLLADPVMGRNVRMVVADAARNPGLARVHDEFVRSRRAHSLELFRRAVARGEMRADVDLEVAADGAAAPIFYRHLVSHMPIDDGYIEQVIDAFLAAYGVATTT